MPTLQFKPSVIYTFKLPVGTDRLIFENLSQKRLHNYESTVYSQGRFSYSMCKLREFCTTFIFCIVLYYDFFYIPPPN